MSNETSIPSFSEAIKRNPFSAITTFIAIAGVAVSLFNLYFLSQLVPLSQRVSAIETRNSKSDELIEEFYNVKTTVHHIELSVNDIKTDLRDIKAFLNVR